MKSYETYLAEETARQKEAAQRAVDALNAKYAEKLRAATAATEDATAQATAEQHETVSRATLQQQIDAQLLAERMANLGLSGSGLEQAARQGIDRSTELVSSQAQQKARTAIERLRRKLREKADALEASRAAAEQSIWHNYYTQAAQDALARFRADQEVWLNEQKR